MSGLRMGLAVTVLVLGLTLTLNGWAQFELRPIDDTIKEGLTTGTTSPERPYFGEAKEQLREIDLGPFVPPPDEQGREREVYIIVKEGERIFCAHCGTLLRNNTQFRRVTMEESVNYFDDGTHGDLIPNDGLPSNIRILDDDFIGPRCYQHMLLLESLRDRAEYRDAYSAAFLGINPMEPEEPQTFFTQVKVAPLDSESRLAFDPYARYMPGTPGVEERYSFVAMDDLRKQRIREFEEAVIREFKHKPMYIDYYLHRNEINPYVPSMAAPGPGSGVPGIQYTSRWQQLRQQAQQYQNPPLR